MAEFQRINELKKLSYISEKHNVLYSDLLLKDENDQTFLDYIIKKKVSILDKNLLKEISKNYEMLYYMFSNNYYIDKFDNIDILFEKKYDKTLIELMFEKNSFKLKIMSLEIIYRLFEKTKEEYPINKLLEINEDNCKELIKKINNINTLYNCFKDIGKLDLLKYANENCLISQLNNETVLENLIKMNVNISDITDDKSFRIAKILYDNKQYDALLKMDCQILMNYPNSTNNYLELLIQKYRNGENIPFENMKPKSENNKIAAEVNMIFLKNNIKYQKPSSFDLINPFDFYNRKPILLYMLENDRNIVFKFFDSSELLENLKYYLQYNRNFPKESLDNLSFDELYNLLPQKKQFEQDLIDGKITSIEQNTYYSDCLFEPMNNGMTPYEYALINNIPIKLGTKPSINEILLLVKYKKDINSINEQTLYEEIAPNKKVIDYLIENKYYYTINYSCENDLRIIDYCIKYNRFDIINNNILDELFVISNNHFLGEKLLNNPNFQKKLENYVISKESALKLYQLGYKNLLINSSENLLLSKINNKTILDDLLDSNISPTFHGYDFQSMETLNILLKHNRLDLLYNAKLELLMNYPSKDNNYLQLLINAYKKGTKVNFEKMAFKYGQNEDVARCYIQMTQNELYGFLDNLEEDDLLKKDEKNNSLLYYLINLDKDLTLNKIIRNSLKKKESIFTELKMLGVDEALLNLSYDKFDCSEICLNIYNDEYAQNINSPVEELLNELKILFEKDGKSDMNIINALITSYRYCTIINPIFIEELKKLITIKQQHPDFYYTKQIDAGYFSQFKGVVVEDNTISTLNHETGHAMHYYLTNYEVPPNYNELINSINQEPKWLDNINQYSIKFQEILKKIREQAKQIVDKYIVITQNSDDEKRIDEMLNTEKEKMIQKYLEKGYSRETLDIVLSSSFTRDEFVSQKKEIEIEEVVDMIMRTEYDAFISIGDIIDAISTGKFRSSLLHNDEQETILPAYGHGVKYYYRDDINKSSEIKFTEMIANYSSIIKSKQANEIIKILRDIVGNELVDMLDNFYKSKFLNLEEYKYETERTR